MLDRFAGYVVIYRCKVIDALQGQKGMRCNMKAVTTTADIGRRAERFSRYVRIADEDGGIRVYRKFVPDHEVFDYVHNLLERAVMEVQELQNREMTVQLVKDWSVHELVDQFIRDSSVYVKGCKESDISCQAIEKAGEAFAILRYIVGEEIFQTEFIGRTTCQIEG